MEWVLVWLLCGFIAMAVGSRKGEGCGAFLLGCILGPFGIVFAVMSRGNRVQCPHCRELIHRTATACPHCQRDTQSNRLARTATPTAVNVERLLIGAIVLFVILILAKQAFGA